MGLEFVGASLAAALVIYVPGFLAGRALRLSRFRALCVAPALTYALLSVLSCGYPLVGIGAGPASMLLVPCAVLLALAVAMGRRGDPRGDQADRPWWLVALYVLMGLVVGGFVFISVLPGFDALISGRDMPHHLNGVRAFVDSRNFSSFGVSAYATARDAAIHPNGPSGGGFYPSTWQGICALVVMLGFPTVSVVMNAVNFVLAAVVTPLSALALLVEAYPGERRIQALGAVPATCFVAFPWRFLTFGPIFPNLAGFAVVLGVASLVLRATADGLGRAERARTVAAVLLGVLGMAFMHPNTAFTLGLLIGPYLVWRIFEAGGVRAFGRTLPAWPCAVALTALAVALWYGCYRSPVMRGAVTMDWPFALSEAQALVNILTCAYTHLWLIDFGQPLLAAALVLGALWALRSRDGARLWPVASYGLAALVVFVNTIDDGPLQDLFSGFWYNDPARCAALAALLAVPCAACGLAWASEAVGRVLAGPRDEGGASPARVAVPATMLLSLLVVLFPSFFMPGADPLHLLRDRSYRVESEVEYERISVAAYYSQTEGFLTADERAFLRKAVAVTGRDALVLNLPFDGSAVAYGDVGMRTYYRGINPMSSGYDTDESHVTRVHIDEIATNEEVQKAVRDLGAEYVLLLSRERDTEDSMRWNFDPLQWQGYDRITDDTPGFEVVLADGDFRLYRIDV